MADEAGAGSGIGSRLRAGRERVGLTILQAAERLHVDAKILESLEAENFDSLGAPVYARGHLRHYAELVGESGQELNALYSSLIGTVLQPDLTQIAKAPPSTESNRMILPALLGLSVFAVAGAVWWISSMSVKRPATAPVVVVGKTTADPSMPQTLDQTPVTPALRAPATVESGAPATLAPAAQNAAASQPRAGTTAVKGAAPTNAAATTSGASSPAVAAVDAAAHSAHDSQLTLRFSADSWTEVYDSAGQRLFYDVGAANSVRVLKGTPPLRVVVGNASGVSVEINGHNTSMAKLSQKDGSAQITINRSGKVARARPVKSGG
jgi:cytoskeleton protein RodZ